MSESTRYYPRCLPARILYLLENSSHALHSWEIADQLDMSVGKVGDALANLRADGKVDRYGDPRGYAWSIPVKLVKPERGLIPPIISW